MASATWFGFHSRVLAKEVFLFCGCQSGVAVRRADNAKLVGVGAQLPFEFQAVLECFAGVFVLEHPVFLGRGAEVGFVPGFVVRKLVIGAEEGVGFTVTFDLGDFVEGFPLSTALGVVAGQRLAGVRVGFDREHQAVRDVTVVGQGEDAAAGFLFISAHPVPEVFGVEGLGCGERQHLAGAAGVVAIDNVSVQVVACLSRGPFIANEGGEGSGVVIVIRDFGELIPDRLDKATVAGGFGQGIARDASKGFDHLHCGRQRCVAALVQAFVPIAQTRISHQRGVAIDDLVHGAHGVRVVGDHEPVEGARKLDAQAVRSCDFVTAGELVGLSRTQHNAKGPRVERVRRMQVCVSPKWPDREIASGIG